MAKNQKISYNNVIVEMARDISQWKFEMKKLLKDCGEDIEDKSFTELMKMVENLKVMKKNRKYKGILRDNNGYITGVYNLNDFIEAGTMPDDIDYGYYKINKDGVLEIDFERKRQIEEV